MGYLYVKLNLTIIEKTKKDLTAKIMETIANVSLGTPAKFHV